MLRSVVISLTAESSYPILGALGRPIQAWFLGQITRTHPALAAKLHDEQGLKPYTVSTLLDQRARPLRAGAWLEPGEECYLRITTLNEELSEAFEKTVIRRTPKNLALYKMDFRINDILSKRSEHDWAGETSFSDLAQDGALAKASEHIRMEFVSPTAFRSNGLDICHPAPGQVFRSLFDKWNAFAPSPMRIQDLWTEFSNTCILIEEMTAVNTVHWKFAEGTRGAATGFTGTIGFQLLPKNKIKKEWLPYWDGTDVVMQSLSRFAFYSGVGHHSTIGMGQARIVPNSRLDPIAKKASIPVRLRK
jgi:CRISPR-associated endoribonuclease Cas6